MPSLLTQRTTKCLSSVALISLQLLLSVFLVCTFKLPPFFPDQHAFPVSLLHLISLGLDLDKISEQ